jgi:cell division septation protein DedD
MSRAAKGKQEAETRIVHWTQLLMWGLFLSVVMFFLGFLVGYRKAEKEVLVAARPPVLGVVPRLPEPGSSDAAPRVEEEEGGVWGILTEQDEAVPARAKPAPAARKPVTGPAATQETPMVSPETKEAGTLYSVQVGASRDGRRAEALRAELARKGYPHARVEKAEISGSGTWYRIRVGLLRDKEAAADLAVEVQRREGVKPRVVVERVNE